jgi:hypothetical protein
MTIAGLPAGLAGTTSANQVVIAGTPTVAGTFSVTVTATDPFGHDATANYALSVLPIGWTDRDIGSPGVPSAELYSAKPVTRAIGGGGSDI